MAKIEPQYYSISQVSCFRGCKKEWEYRYRDRLQLRAPQRPLYMGSTIHKLLELRANGEDWKEYLNTKVRAEFEAMPADYQAELGEDFLECCFDIMSQYDWAYQNENIKYLKTELKIDCKIRGRKRFIGIVDAICELDGKQYLMEHKSFKSNKMSLDQTWLNAQTCLYIKVLNEHYGYNIVGVIWDMIKTSAPQPPRVLKSGQFGKQYGDQTLYSFAKAGVEDIPQDIYEEIKDNYKNFVDRYITPVIPSVVESVWVDFVQTVDEISKCKVCPKSLGRDCDWCGFKNLCQTELTGGDVEYTKQLYYTTPEQREQKLFAQYCQTPECKACQKLADTCGVDIDPQQCIADCVTYKKFKEEANK